MNSSTHYDVAIIGAGMAGLAAGIRLAHFGKKVCIFERHNATGGLNSFYSLGGRKYDVAAGGLHRYVGDGASRYAQRGRHHRHLERQRDLHALSRGRRGGEDVLLQERGPKRGHTLGQKIAPEHDDAPGARKTIASIMLACRRKHDQQERQEKCPQHCAWKYRSFSLCVPAYQIAMMMLVKTSRTLVYPEEQECIIH
jgi:glycine/D-amino acid oxidase-like deaminating enzyme